MSVTTAGNVQSSVPASQLVYPTSQPTSVTKAGNVPTTHMQSSVPASQRGYPVSVSTAGNNVPTTEGRSSATASQLIFDTSQLPTSVTTAGPTRQVIYRTPMLEETNATQPVIYEVSHSPITPPVIYNPAPLQMGVATPTVTYRTPKEDKTPVSTAQLATTPTSVADGATPPLPEITTPTTIDTPVAKSSHKKKKKKKEIKKILHKMYKESTEASTVLQTLKEIKDSVQQQQKQQQQQQVVQVEDTEESLELVTSKSVKPKIAASIPASPSEFGEEELVTVRLRRDELQACNETGVITYYELVESTLTDEEVLSRPIKELSEGDRERRRRLKAKESQARYYMRKTLAGDG